MKPVPESGKPADRQSIVRRHVQNHWVLLASLILLSLIATVTSLVLPKMQGQLIDSLITTDRNRLLLLVQLLVVASVLSLLLGWGKGLLGSVYRNRVERDISMELQANVLNKAYAYFVRHDQGYIQSRSINDVSALEPFYSTSLINSAAALFSLVLALSAAMLIDVFLTLMALGLIVLAVAASGLFTRALQHAYHQKRSAYDALLSCVVNYYENIITLKTCNAIPFALSKLRGLFAGYCDNNTKEQQMKVHFATVTGISSAVAPIAVLIVGGLKVVERQLTVGDLFAFLGYLAYMSAPFAFLSSYLAERNSARAARERIEAFMAEANETRNGRQELKTPIRSITLTNVGFGYQGAGELSAVKNVSLGIESGDRVAIVGPSGSGKSTILKLMVELESPQSGSIQVNGHDYADYTRESKFKHIAYLQTSPGLLKGSIRENLALGEEISDTTIDTVLEKLQLAGKVRSLPHGLDSEIDTSDAAFSDGEKQRIAFARVMLRHHELILMDEATNNLDFENREAIYRLLLEHATEKMIVMVSHMPETSCPVNKTLTIERNHSHDA